MMQLKDGGGGGPAHLAIGDVNDNDHGGSSGSEDESEFDTTNNSNSNSNGITAKKNKNEDDGGTPILSRAESRKIFGVKLIVLFVLTLFAILTGWLVYYSTHKTERIQFEEKFKDDAFKLLDSVGKTLDMTFGATTVMATSLASEAKTTNQSWPFVTINDYAVRCVRLLSMTSLLTITVVPLVTNETRAEWEIYTNTSKNVEWLDNAIELQDTWKGYFGPPASELEQYDLPYQIHDDYGPLDYNISWFMPGWQSFPVVSVRFCFSLSLLV